MKTKKSIALLLCLLLTLTLFVPSSTAFAVDGDSGTDTGMRVSKTATANNDGSYTIKLEAYATGNKVISEVKKDIPTDIVLVLDQSGSMEQAIGTVSFEPYEDERDWSGMTYHTRNQDYYECRHNGGSGNLWYYDENSETYYSVSVTVKPEYTEIKNGRNNSTYGGATNYWDNKNNLYAKVNGEPQKVKVSRSSNWINKTYTYTLPNGTIIGTESGSDGIPRFTGIDGNVLYLASTLYTYTYTDANGVTQTIGSSTGETTVPDFKLYERTVNENAGDSRLNALKTAVTTFVRNVSVKAAGADGNIATTEDNIDHRIAIVGFASTGSRYENTELLSTSNVVNYKSAQSTDYKNALVSVNDNGQLNSRLTTAINRLDASGDTYLQYGMDMANKIFAQYPISEEDTSARQRVVVVFTDGYPAPAGTDTFNYKMADDAISNALTTKNEYKATVYTVGVISGADPSANIETGFTYGGTSSNQQKVASNRYMHYVSSNYPSASSMQSGGSLNPDAKPFNGGDSYYLSASDASTLNNIFQQIANKIESGGSSTTLTEQAVVKDIIAPQFTLPAGATADSITLKTHACTGKDGDEFTWSENKTVMGAHVDIDQITDENGVVSNTVSVTGFDFSENWCGTVTEDGKPTYRGNKLVISFKVVPKDGFLGGNNVYTNTSAGIYENGSAATPVKEFNRPQVNVPIGDITVTAADKNVYLLGSLTADQLKSDATVSVGGVSLNLAAENYGLESWQTEFVDIEVLFKDQRGNIRDFSYFSSLDEDEQYYIYVIVSPKDAAQETSNGDPATPQNGERIANINVFMPEMTFEDGEIGYLENLPTDFGAHRVPYTEGETDYVQWVHTEAGENGTRTISKNVTMQGDEPTITLEYEAVSGVTAGKVTDPKVVPIDVTAKIGGTDVTAHVTFAHKACTLVPPCEWSDHERTEKFLLHVRTGELTIYKSGMYDHVYTSGSDVDHESAIFTITGPDGTTWQVTIPNGQSVTLTNLQPGEYTVTEVSTWSWRYGTVDATKVVMSGSSNSETRYNCLSIINKQDNPYWLGGDNYRVNKFAAN